MKPIEFAIKLTRRASAFTRIELLVVIVIIGVLAVLATLRQRDLVSSRRMTGTLSNARQLHLATQTMALDTAAAGGNGMSWTTRKLKGQSMEISLQQYFEALIKSNCLTERDLKKLLTAPGKGPGDNAPTAQNSCFKFFQVDETSRENQPLMVTVNWQQDHLSSEAPYGKTGFVLFTKGGSGGAYRRATDITSKTLFPIKDSDGYIYNYNTLK